MAVAAVVIVKYAVKYVRVYKVFPTAYILHSIYMTYGFINTMIRLVILYPDMIRVDEFINISLLNINLHKLILYFIKINLLIIIITNDYNYVNAY